MIGIETRSFDEIVKLQQTNYFLQALLKLVFLDSATTSTSSSFSKATHFFFLKEVFGVQERSWGPCVYIENPY